MRIGAVLFLALSLAACNSGTRSNEAVHQGIVDYLAKAGLNTNAMDVSVTTVDYKGNEADATAAISLKGSATVPAMSRKYHLQQKGSQWEVTSSADAGASSHGAGAIPGAQNPHAGGPPTPGSGKMPSPDDLPPSGTKK